jgi:hypothetical protein
MHTSVSICDVVNVKTNEANVFCFLSSLPLLSPRQCLGGPKTITLYFVTPERLA